MKKLRYVFLFLLLTAALATAAFAADTFDPGRFTVTAPDDATITVVFDAVNDSIYRQLKPDIAIPCGFAQAKVTDPDGNELACTLETLATPDGENVKVVTFQVAKAGTYTITSVAAANTSDPGVGYIPETVESDAAPAGTETQNADGSVTTTTVDEATGAVTETTVAADGSAATVKTDADGNLTEAAASVSEEAAAAAAAAGEPVTLPLEVPAAASADEAVAIPVEIPEAVDSVKVEIPVENVGPGTVVVVVHEDGTEEIVKTTQLTENGLAVTLDGSCTVKIVDNTQDYGDVTADDWGADAVNYVTARELFIGTGGGSFDPDAPMTRGMMMTVLARSDGADAYGEDWQAKGVAWAVEAGVSDGSAPEAPITREELVVMLWRLSGCPAASAETLAARPDGDTASEFAVQALAWAVETGVMQGDENGCLDPQGIAGRRQVAQLLMNYINNA